MSKRGKHNAVDVLREESSTELIVLKSLQVMDLELVMVAASQLLQETLLVAIRAAARIEPSVRDEPCVKDRKFALPLLFAGWHASTERVTSKSSTPQILQEHRNASTHRPSGFPAAY